MAETVLLDVRDAIATVTLNRPGRRNALDLDMTRQLPEAVERAATDAKVRVIVLRGAGDAFMVGGDVDVFLEHLGHGTQDDLVSGMKGFQRTVACLRGAHKPVLCSARGAVAGGGLSLVLAADLAIVSENARFNVAYAGLGCTPDGGLSYHLPRTLGIKKALELALLTEKFHAQTALSLGIVNWVVPDDQLDAQTDRLAQRLAAGPTRVFGRTKLLFNEAFDRSLSEQLRAEEESFVDCFAGSPDFSEGVRAYAEKRPPRFRGR
jgi:2-(1,2-epoxy-1,2-dihydrophenyl)acetyl-CoA isomerase